MGDIYEDLENYDDFSHLEQLKGENEELKAKLKNNEMTLEKLQKDYDTLTLEHQGLLTNYSTLLKTARAEIQRKTDTIVMVNKEKDNLFLRMLNNSTNRNKNPNFHNIFNNRKPEDNNVKPSKSIESNKQLVNATVETERINNANKKTVTTTSENLKMELPKTDKTEFTVKDKENPEVNMRPASIAARRKSMPASRFEAVKFSSDDEDRVTNSSQKSKDDIDRPSSMDIEKPKLPGTRFVPDDRCNVNEPPRYDAMYKEHDRFRRGSAVEPFKFKDMRRNFGPRYHRSRREDFRAEYRPDHRQRDPMWDNKPESFRLRGESPPRDSWSEHHRLRGHSNNRSDLRHLRGESPPSNRSDSRRLRDSPSREIRSVHHRSRDNSPRDFILEQTRTHGHRDIRSDLRHVRGDSPPHNRSESRRLQESPPRDIRLVHPRSRDNSPRDFIPYQNRACGNSAPRDIKPEQNQRFRADSPPRDKEYYRSRGNSPSREIRAETHRPRPESPPRNRYQRTKSRDRRNMYIDRLRQPHELRHRNDEVEQPVTKRRRVDSVHNNTPESIIDVVGEPHGHFSPSQLNTCQSPDETHADVSIDHMPIKEIMHTANTKLEDPRLTSSHYTLIPEENNKYKLCTKAGRDVRLDKLHWGTSSNSDNKPTDSDKCYSVPELLKKPPIPAKVSIRNIMEGGHESNKQQAEDKFSDTNSLESGELENSLQYLYSDLITNNDANMATRLPITESPVEIKPSEIAEKDSHCNTGKYRIPKVNKDLNKKQTEITMVPTKPKETKQKDKDMKEKAKWSVAGDLELSDDSDNDDKPIRNSNKSKGQEKKPSKKGRKSSEIMNNVESIECKNDKTKDIRTKMCDLFGDSSLITPEDLNIPSENQTASSQEPPPVLDEGDMFQGGFFNELSKTKQESPRAYIKSSAEESIDKKNDKPDKRKKNKNEGTKTKNTLELKTELYVVNISNDQSATDEKTVSMDRSNELNQMLMTKKPETAKQDGLDNRPITLDLKDHQIKHDKADKKKKRNKNHEKDTKAQDTLDLEKEKSRLKKELQMIDTASSMCVRETDSIKPIDASPTATNVRVSVITSEISPSMNTSFEADSSVNRNTILDSTDRSEDSMNVEASAPDVRIIVKSRRRKRKLT